MLTKVPLTAIFVVKSKSIIKAALTFCDKLTKIFYSCYATQL